jgi:hypothetical protein
METILFLANTEADGTLGKPALEALSAAVELKNTLGATLLAGLYGEQVQPGADAIANCGAQKIPRRQRRRTFRRRVTAAMPQPVKRWPAPQPRPSL